MDELKYGLMLGILANNGISASKAWSLPSELQLRLTTIDSNLTSLSQLDQLTSSQVIELFNQEPKLHRFNNKIGLYAYEIVVIINSDYTRDFNLLLPLDHASLIQNVSSLPGMSEKKARHLLVYLAAIDTRYQLSTSEYIEYTKDCNQLIEKFDDNLGLLYKLKR